MSRDFPDTQWSQILGLQQGTNPRRSELLEALIGRYWKPAYVYARAVSKGSASDAEDMVQQFFADMLARDGFDQLSPDKGSFRGFLKTALRNVIISKARAAEVRRRPFPFAEAESLWQASAPLSPDDAFDRAWATQLLTEAVTILRAELQTEGRAQELAVFEAYSAGDGNAPAYKMLAEGLGIKEDDVRNRLRESRRRIKIILRRLMREYLAPDQDIDAEIRFVLAS